MVSSTNGIASPHPRAIGWPSFSKAARMAPSCCAALGPYTDARNKERALMTAYHPLHPTTTLRRERRTRETVSLISKSTSSNTQSISCCEQTQFDCNQGRSCPLRASAPSLRAERGSPVPSALNASSHTPPSPATHAAPSATAADSEPSNTRSAVSHRPS